MNEKKWTRREATRNRRRKNEKEAEVLHQKTAKKWSRNIPSQNTTEEAIHQIRKRGKARKKERKRKTKREENLGIQIKVTLRVTKCMKKKNVDILETQKRCTNIAKPMDIRVKKTEILGNRDMPRNTETWRKVDITEKRAVILRTKIKKGICARAVKRKLRTTRNTEAVRKTGIEHKHTGDKYTKSWLSRCNERFEHFGKLK